MKNTTNIYLYAKRLAEIIFTIVLCAFIIKVLNYMYVNDCYNGSASWERDVIDDFYAQEENIDYIYLGTSHVFMDVIPAKMDEINGKNNFNLATPAQSLIASYYLLKEAVKHNELEHVYLDMYYMTLIPYGYGNMDSVEVMTRNWNILYQMPESFNKLSYMCHLANEKYGMMTLFPIRQFSDHVFDTEYISMILQAKKTENYRNSVHIQDVRAPLFEKGFCTTLDYIEPGTFKGHTVGIPEPMFDEGSEEYLYKIIDLCHSKGIGLTLFTAPIPDYRLCCMENYDQYITEIDELAKNNGIHYYDFNLCNPKYLDLQSDTNFMDYEHLSYEGALLFTDILGEVLLAELEDEPLPEDMFYETYNERLGQIDQRIFGLDIQQDTSKERKTYMLYSIDNLTETEAEFRVTKIRNGETEPIMVKEWSTQNCVTFPETETGIFIVEARPAGSREITNRVETEY